MVWLESVPRILGMLWVGVVGKASEGYRYVPMFWEKYKKCVNHGILAQKTEVNPPPTDRVVWLHGFFSVHQRFLLTHISFSIYLESPSRHIFIFQTS